MRSLIAVGAVLSLACLWDYDTLKEESLGQAEIAAILGGDLHKHSTAFYAAKADYTRTVLAKTPSAERYDDLAVALAKTGKFDDALATLDEKATKFPGKYETEANRGTVFAMKGDVPHALEHLKAAIAINPDAHFGREKFQIQFLEFLSKGTPKGGDNFLAIENGKDWAGESSTIIHLSQRAKSRKPAPAIAAIAGLMRFGDAQDNKDLWYGLAWAFVDQGDAQLATRAFRRAEKLGHARAAADGAVVSTAIKSVGAICCPKPDEPAAQKAWAMMTKLADAEWAAGQAADAKRQAAEDKLVATKQFKAAFGY